MRVAGALRFSDNDSRADSSFRGAARALHEVQSRIVRDRGSARNMMTVDLGKMVFWFYSKEEGDSSCEERVNLSAAHSNLGRSEQHVLAVLTKIVSHNIIFQLPAVASDYPGASRMERRRSASGELITAEHCMYV